MEQEYGWTRTLAGLGGGGDGERLGQRGEVHPRGGRRRQAGGGEEKRRQHRRQAGLDVDALLPGHHIATCVAGRRRSLLYNRRLPDPCSTGSSLSGGSETRRSTRAFEGI